jgi:phosphate transport system substrate-binding protein
MGVHYKGGKMGEDLDFVPMPAAVVRTIESVWANDIKDASGKALFTAPR